MALLVLSLLQENVQVYAVYYIIKDMCTISNDPGPGRLEKTNCERSNLSALEGQGKGKNTTKQKV